MYRTTDELGALTRGERRALRRLLVAAVLTADRPGDRDSIEPLIGVAPLHALPSAAALHRVSGVVLRGLEGVSGVPDDVRIALDQHRSRASLHHLLTIGALSEIAQAFDERALDWLTMKGPAATALLYREPGDRTYADLDLLVLPDHFAAAMATLERLGYEPATKNWALAEQTLAGQVNMTGPAIHIDLHWALHYSEDDRRPFGLVPADMIRRARRVDIAGLRVPTFDAADTLVTLAFHAARSGGHRLLWLKDLERSIAVDRPDLDEVARRATASRCGPPVGIMLSRAARVLRADLPDDIAHTLVPASLRLANRSVELASSPVRLHEGDTATRLFTRSARSTTISTASDLPRRAGRRIRRMGRPLPPNETNDPREKARFLTTVTRSGTTSV